MPRRRGLLRWLGGLAVAGMGLGTYALAVEPGMRLRVVRHRLAPAAWPRGLTLRIACLADPHAGSPHTSPARLARVVAAANALRPDLALLLGDYLADHRFTTYRPGLAEVAGILAGLRAPLGTYAVLGNHDWWEDPAAQARQSPLPRAAAALEAAGLRVLHNAALRLEHRGTGLWLAGLGSQWAWRLGGRRLQGADDLAGTLSRIPDGAPAILMAHEPDIFPHVPARVAVTLSGHTHGGQVRILGWSPMVPSRYGNRYAYGHVQEEGRHLVVSGGIGQSILPVRLGVPPEITVVELGDS
jgi:hypothetical protein